MNAQTPSTSLSRAGHVSSALVAGAVTLTIRAAALVLFMLMSLAEPLLAMILGALALACFFVAVLFGFILHMPFQHRWDVLGASVVFLMAYLIYRAVMLGVQRLLQ